MLNQNNQKMINKLLNIGQSRFSEESIVGFINNISEVSVEDSNWAIYCYNDHSNCGFFIFSLDETSPHFATPYGLDMNGIRKDSKDTNFYSYEKESIKQYIEELKNLDNTHYSWNFISEETAKTFLNIMYYNHKMR